MSEFWQHPSSSCANFCQLYGGSDRAAAREVLQPITATVRHGSSFMPFNICTTNSIFPEALSVQGPEMPGSTRVLGREEVSSALSWTISKTAHTLDSQQPKALAVLETSLKYLAKLTHRGYHYSKSLRKPIKA